MCNAITFKRLGIHWLHTWLPIRTARGQLNMETQFSLSPFASENFVWPGPRQPRSFSTFRLNLTRREKIQRFRYRTKVLRGFKGKHVGAIRCGYSVVSECRPKLSQILRLYRSTIFTDVELCAVQLLCLSSIHVLR